ncbi:lactonase family protein [Agromyces sp. NPDC058104]|uniref:lactonase family protein n=1 Tax=Agromyces sp. NPDC058104 TaxID=3346342 RepID=UPI0036DC365D
MQTEFWVGASTLGRIGSTAEGVRRLTVAVDGTLTLGDPIEVGANPMFLAWHRGVIGIVHELPDGRVSVWLAEGEGLTPVAGPSPTGAAAPCHIEFSADGSKLFVANYAGGSVSLHNAGTAGLLGSVALHGSGPHQIRQLASHPHQIVRDERRRRILVPDLGSDRICAITVDPTDSRKLVHEASDDHLLHPGAGPRHLVVAGDLAVVANELDRTVSIVDLVESAEIRCVRIPGLRSKTSLGISAIRRTAAGTVLVGDRATDAVHAFRFDERDRSLEHLVELRTGGRYPRDLELTHDERYLLVADQASDSIAVVEIDPMGVPSTVVGTVPTPAPACLMRLPVPE